MNSKSDKRIDELKSLDVLHSLTFFVCSVLVHFAFARFASARNKSGQKKDTLWKKPSSQCGVFENHYSHTKKKVSTYPRLSLYCIILE